MVLGLGWDGFKKIEKKNNEEEGGVGSRSNMMASTLAGLVNLKCKIEKILLERK